jgi:protein disulfide-isomerase A6
MKSIVIFASVLALAFAAVVDLTPDNFDTVVHGSKGAFVEFFAPWCGHCKHLAPEYEVVGEVFEKETTVVVAKVDADAHRELGTRFEVHSYPTLKWFPKGSTVPENYEGGRTADDIIAFINEKAGTKARVKKAPSHVVELDSNNFNKIALDPTKTVLVEFYAPWCGHCKRLIPDYEKLALAFSQESSVVIAKIDADKHKDVGSKYGVSGFPTIKIFGKDKENPEAFEGNRDVEGLVKFVNEKAGTTRDAKGRLDSQAGRIPELDAIAVKFVEAADKDALIKEAEKIVAGLTGAAAENGKVYTRLMGALKSKGKALLESEPARIEKLLSGNVTPAKVDEFTIRRNILAAFSS